MRKYLYLAGVAGVLLSACGEPGSTRSSADQRPVAAASPARDADCNLLGGTGPRLAAVDNWFGPDCLIVRGDSTLYVQNLGEYKHSFTISRDSFRTKPYLLDIQLPGGDDKPRAAVLAETLDPGKYEFFCSYHGGMDGVIELIEPATT